MRSLVFSLSLYAIWVSAQAAGVDSLLSAGQVPVGGVIEIVERDTEALAWALAEVRKLTRTLHQYSG